MLVHLVTILMPTRALFADKYEIFLMQAKFGLLWITMFICSDFNVLRSIRWVVKKIRTKISPLSSISRNRLATYTWSGLVGISVKIKNINVIIICINYLHTISIDACIWLSHVLFMYLLLTCTIIPDVRFLS